MLTLHLKTQYFDQIKAGTKTVEYRLKTPYWEKRLRTPHTHVEICKGYPKRGDQTRRLLKCIKYVLVETITHPEFGDLPVEVFAIYLAD